MSSVADMWRVPVDSFERTNFYFGLGASILGHLLALYILIFGVSSKGVFEEPIVYSITLEGGKSLGGMSQVPKETKDKAMAPAKNVRNPTKGELPKEEKAEVSVKEEKKEVKVVKKGEEKKEEAKKEVKKKPEVKSKEPTPDDINKRLQAAVQRYVGESSDAGGKGFGAAKLGGNSMGGGVIRPPEFFTYKKLLEDRIKDGWRWYDTNAVLIARVDFSISPEGRLSNVQISQGSGNREFDESVVRAVLKGDPAPAPPGSVYEFFKDVRMTFDPRE